MQSDVVKYFPILPVFLEVLSTMYSDGCTPTTFCDCRDHRNVVSCCAFSHNNHWLLTGSWDKNLHLYNVADGTFR